MKIAIYGVSASGKDHLIGDLVDYLAGRGVALTHVPGSATLNELSKLRYGRRFSSLGEEGRAALRVRFADELGYRERECGNVVVDGHFAFYTEDGSLADVFTDSDLATYDLFFYLDTDEETVAQRSADRGYPISADAVRAWQEHEVEGLTACLLEAGKELHVIRDDGEPTLRFIMEAMRGERSSEQIAKGAVAELTCVSTPGVVCLVDCDRTLVEEDTTALLLKRKGVRADGLVDVYRRDRYTNYQSFMASGWLPKTLEPTGEDIDWICESATPNAGLLASLAENASVPVIAVTAGPGDIWSPLLERLGVRAKLLDTRGVMSKYVKYFVVRELQRMGHFVVAVGDSMLDSLMLEQADRSYLYAGKGRRESMASLLDASPNIRQFSFCGYQYPGTPSDGAICWVDCLNTRDGDIARDISVCKSSSGATGRVLRKAHHRLGMRLGGRISSCMPEKEFVAVAMMRSGLPLAEGIADELDCPMLFFAGDVDELRAQIADNGFEGRRILLVDGVVNTGKSLADIVAGLGGLDVAVAASVVSSVASLPSGVPVFSARTSDNSYVGAKQWEVSGGKGPDTADRLFRTM